MRLIRIGSVGLLAVLVALVGIALWFRQATQPLHEGRLRAPGLAEAARIERDAHGVPHVTAASERDAMFALGFAHAQDRLWQMEMNRRIAAGRLAEILGPRALDTDRYIRTLGIRRIAERIAGSLDGETRRLVEAYAAGVNASVAARGGPLPVEFQLIGAPTPEPWKPVDSIGWSLMMAWDLARYSHFMELRRLQLAQRFSLAEINDIFPPDAGDAAAPTADYVEAYRLMGLRQAGLFDAAAHLAAAAPQTGVGIGDEVGTNAWVAAGPRTVSGKPLLAHDPHLGLSTPSLWYFASLQAPGLDVIGATLPGVPGVLVGRNDRVAWSFSNAGVDQQDLYLERLNPANPDEYATPDGWRSFERHVEIIRVKGEPDAELVVRRSRHGPVLSGLGQVDKALSHPQFAVSLRWAADENEDTSLAAIRALNRARSADQAEAALSRFTLVTQAALIADVDGEIGMYVTGRIPIRSRDNDLHGSVPAPGWDARYDWLGYLPAGQAPRLRNPPGGTIVAANQKIVGPEYPHHLTYDWAPPYRSRRIEALLQERARHDATTFKRMQADVRSLAALDVLALLKKVQPMTAAGRDGMARLQAWDGIMAADRPEPLVFHAWMRELKRRLFADDFGPLTDDFIDASERTTFLVHVLSGRAQGRDWCDDRSTEHRIESCEALAAEALDTAVAALTAASGRDVAGLRWGEAHVAIAEHRPLSGAGFLARLFELRTAVPGDTHTINVGALTHRREAPYTTRHAASLRAIYDFANLRDSAWVHTTGQSGSAFSGQYASMLPLWRDGRYLPMRRPEGGDAAVLELLPR